MRWPGWINSKKFRICAAAGITLILVFALLAHLLANKAKGNFSTIYGNMSAVGGSLICDSGQTGAHYEYDAYYKTGASPENYLVSTAQKNGYIVVSDLSLISSISKPGGDQTIPYNHANFYLSGTKQNSQLKIRIFQFGVAKLWCKGANWNKAIDVSLNKPVVEVKFSQ